MKPPLGGVAGGNPEGIRGFFQGLRGGGGQGQLSQGSGCCLKLG